MSYTVDNLRMGQILNLKLNLILKLKVNQSLPNTTGILIKVFYTSGPILVILVGMGYMLSRR